MASRIIKKNAEALKKALMLQKQQAVSAQPIVPKGMVGSMPVSPQLPQVPLADQFTQAAMSPVQQAVQAIQQGNTVADQATKQKVLQDLQARLGGLRMGRLGSK